MICAPICFSNQELILHVHQYLDYIQSRLLVGLTFIMLSQEWITCCVLFGAMFHLVNVQLKFILACQQYSSVCFPANDGKQFYPKLFLECLPCYIFSNFHQNSFSSKQFQVGSSCPHISLIYSSCKQNVGIIVSSFSYTTKATPFQYNIVQFHKTS